MFCQVLSIDVAERIENFANEMKKFSQHPPISVADARLLDFKSFDASKIEALLVSIHHEASANFLSKFANLKYVGVLGSSTKKIAMDYCRQNNICVSSVSDYCDHETAEWVILQALKFFRDGKTSASVYEKSFGVIGTGAVGMQVAKLGLSLGMKILFNANTDKPALGKFGAAFCTKQEIFQRCDVVSFHTPPYLAWLDAEMLSSLKHGAFLINSCMGKVSSGNVLETFLADRPDVTMAIDGIAALTYKKLDERHVVDKRPAFSTPESEQRLVEKFLHNLSDKF